MAPKRSLFLAALMLAASSSLRAQVSATVDVFKSPYCGCCEKWAEHMKDNGFKVNSHNVEDLGASRKKMGMPDRYASCHTAKVAGYVLEGHVPAADVKRLLKEKPKALGLASPGMPAGSPGMDIPNSPPYEVLLVQKDGASRVFAKH